MLDKQREVGQKAYDKIQKTCDELLRDRDVIHKELKKTESTFMFTNETTQNTNARIMIYEILGGAHHCAADWRAAIAQYSHTPVSTIHAIWFPFHSSFYVIDVISSHFHWLFFLLLSHHRLQK